MKSTHLLQREALRQFFSPLPRTHLSQSTFRQIRYNSQATFRTRPFRHLTSPPRSPFSPPRSQIKLPNTSRTFRRFQSAQAGANDANLSFSQRLRKLSREYGWTAVGVYFALSALDFPFCFLAVKLLGTDRIGHWEHAVMSYVKELIKWPLGLGGQGAVDGATNEVGRVGQETLPLGEGPVDGQKRILEQGPTYIADDHGYHEAEKANTGENASIWTQLALAYAIHKSFIFLRVPLTAAVLPKVVKTLRSWGWNIGKMPKKKALSGTGVNTGKAGVKSDR